MNFEICSALGGLGFPLTITLDEAIERALEHNEGILVARNKITEAEAGVIIGRSGFLPKINIQGSYTRLAKLPSLEMAAPEYGELQVPVFNTLGIPTGYTIVPGVVGIDTMAFRMGEEENYLSRASLQQPLFTWGKILNAYQISKLNFEAEREDFRKQKNELVFNVTKSFYGILVLNELIKLTSDAYTQTKRHVKVVEKRYNAGLASKFDLLRAKVQLANMEPQVIKAKNGLEIAKIGIKTLLGLSQDTIIKLKGELRVGAYRNTPLQKCIKDAKANRPEIKSLQLRKNMTLKALSIAKRANFPNLAFIANYDYKKPLYFENEWGTDWNVTLALQFPLLTGFETLGKIRQANARVSQAEHGLNLLKDAIELEVRMAYLQLEESKRIVESQEKNIAQAKEALSIVDKRYKQGLATSLEVMDTQLALTKAKTNWLQSLSDYLIAKAGLEKATGRNSK
ncbi:TolC family protein [candidate division WOR-3 bacterium]|nr:TolC family protein [candidate division WOR-3 bacterium]